mgnify:CR=1 FL=1
MDKKEKGLNSLSIKGIADICNAPLNYTNIHWIVPSGNPVSLETMVTISSRDHEPPPFVAF